MITSPDGRPIVMGILNVTPDSFSDGGRYNTVDAAIAHAQRMVAEGADVIDVGGESTRPGAIRITTDEEQQRVLPVVRTLVDQGIAVSIDTMHAETAFAAVELGAALVNDVSGGQADPKMVDVMAELEVPCVLMHWRAFGDTMDQHAHYDDVVTDVLAELAIVRDRAINAGVASDRIILDPGLGFAKNSDHNWQLLHALDQLQALGHPLLIGASRKRFLGALLQEQGEPRAVDARDDASDAVAAIAAFHGVWGVRVHRVSGARDAVSVGHAWRSA
jgi:dihydropteroate synthase